MYLSGFLEKYGRAINWLAQLFGYFGLVSLFAMSLMVGLDVLTRNILGTSIPGTHLAVGHYFMVIIGFLPLGLAERLNSHIVVDLLVSKLPIRRQWVIQRLVWVLVLAVLLFITWKTFEKGLEQYEIGTIIVERDVPVPIWPAYFAVPLGFALYAGVVLDKLLSDIFGQADREMGLK